MDGDELVFLYQLKEGICQSSYAANIATLAGLPASIVQRGVEVDTHTRRETATEWRARFKPTADVCWQVSHLYRTGRAIKHVDKASSDEQANRFVELSLHLAALKQASAYELPVIDRCKSLVERFLSLNLEDQHLDLQHFMKEELLPSAGELLSRTWVSPLQLPSRLSVLWSLSFSSAVLWQWRSTLRLISLPRWLCRHIWNFSPSLATMELILTCSGLHSVF